MNSYKDYLNSLHFSDYASSIDNLNQVDLKKQTLPLELSQLSLEKHGESLEDQLSAITDIKDQATTIGSTALGAVGTLLGAKHAKAIKGIFNKLTGKKEEEEKEGDDYELPEIEDSGETVQMPPPDLQPPATQQMGEPLANTDGVPGGMEDTTGLETIAEDPSAEENENVDIDDDINDFADNLDLPPVGGSGSGSSATTGATEAGAEATEAGVEAGVEAGAEATATGLESAGATVAASTGAETLGVGAIIGGIIALVGAGVSAAEGIESAVKSNSEDSTVDQELADKKQEIQDSLEAHTMIYRNSNVLPVFSSTNAEQVTSTSF